MFVEKRQVAFGIRQNGSGTFVSDPGSFAGVPSPEYLDAGAGVIPAGIVVENSVHDSAVPIQVPGKAHSKGPITAICISGDSPIASVNLRVGNETYRISPQRPFIGTIPESAFVGVLPARNTPMIYRFADSVPTLAQFRSWVVAWDMPTIEKLASGTFHLGADVAAPKPVVKLDLYRGAIGVLPSSRATYHAEMDWSMLREGPQGEDPINATWNNPALLAIVDGRRRIRVSAYRFPDAGDGLGATGVPANLKIWGIEGFKSTNYLDPAVWSARVDSPMFDELMASTAIPDNTTGRTGLIFDYAGNPYYAILIRVLADTVTNDVNRGPFGTDGGKGYVALEAWDE